MKTKLKPSTPRTFGDLRKPAYRHLWVSYASDAVPLFRACRFCKTDSMDAPLAQYSPRHYVCDGCIETRKDDVLRAGAR